MGALRLDTHHQHVTGVRQMPAADRQGAEDPVPTSGRRPSGRASRSAGAAASATERVVLNLDPPAAELAESREARRRVCTRWTARPATPADADLLHVSQGTIVLEIVRTLMDGRGRVLKATTTLCPAAGTVLHHTYPVPTGPVDTRRRSPRT
jgi:hypothetical protein